MTMRSVQLQSASPADYIRAAIPIADDDAIRSYVRAAANDLRENGVIPSFTPEEAWYLIAFAERMAALAVRDHSTDRIKEGLLALALERGEEEFQESLGTVAVLWDAATNVTSDPGGLFASCCRGAPKSQFLEALQQFPRRPQEERTLKAWGYRVRTDHDCFRYWRWGRPG